MGPQPYVDPSRLFAIRLPEGFTRDLGAQSLVFVHPDLDGAVTITCLRHRVGEGVQRIFDNLPGREDMQHVSSRHERGMEISYGDYEGELQNRPEAWRWWVLQRGPVGVVVSFNGSPEAAHGHKALVDELVEGVQIAEKLPLAQEEFTALAADVYARSLQRDKPVVVRPLELNTGKGSLLRLENAYSAYLDALDQDPATDAAGQLALWLESLWGRDAEALPPCEEARGLIYPALKPAGFAADTRIPLLRRNLLERELDVLAALDTGRTLRFLGAEDLKQWPGVSEDDVFFYARENLLAASRELSLQTLAGEDGTPRAVIFAAGDSFDAARLFLPDLYQKLAEVLGNDLLVGVPNRDFMIVVAAGDAELVERVAAQVRTDAETRPYAISGKLYRLKADSIENL
ncbi:MAG: DUF1444 family protein [Planctomycetes bacterium]|nr:DUF1444 family protein [Planctomycetota bacterium]